MIRIKKISFTLFKTIYCSSIFLVEHLYQLELGIII